MVDPARVNAEADTPFDLPVSELTATIHPHGDEALARSEGRLKTRVTSPIGCLPVS